MGIVHTIIYANMDTYVDIKELGTGAAIAASVKNSASSKLTSPMPSDLIDCNRVTR